jgi:hypothetical protein
LVATPAGGDFSALLITLEGVRTESSNLPSGRARVRSVMTAEPPRQEISTMTSNALEPGKGQAATPATVRPRAEGVKLPVYKHLFDINAGFDQVDRGLAALRKNDAFVARELDRYRALAKEPRAATNSYLIVVMEQGRRREREQREDGLG